MTAPNALVELRQRYDELAADYGLTPEGVINGSRKKSRRRPRAAPVKE